MLTDNKNPKQSTRILFCAAAFAFGMVGCAADDVADAESGADEAVSDLALQATPSQATLPNGNSTYFKSVVANGTGCPPGTWDVSVSADGLTFTMTFSQYETAVDSTKAVDVKDCQLGVKLNSPAGYSIAVSDFSYTGYAYLERNVEVRQTANYYFQGAPVPSSSTGSAITGPYDDSFLFTDTVETEDMVWSPCGVERDLQITTRLRLRNSNPRRSGYSNVTAVDGATSNGVTVPLDKLVPKPFNLVVKLWQKRC